MPYKYVPEPYQEYTTDYIFNNTRCGVFLEMGLGKTVSTLTALERLIFKEFEVRKVLVLAPKLVAQHVWSDEIDKWEHLNRLKYSRILGNEKQRIEGLRAKAHIYLMNYENIPWLVAYMQSNGMAWTFDTVVADESSRIKAHDSKRHKALKEMVPFVKRFYLLTGTPMANGYMDLWAPFYFLDKGERLGKKITTYRNNFFVKTYSGWGYILKSKNHGKRITELIADLCVSMRQKDYLQLPERIIRPVRLHMGTKLLAQYREFVSKRVMELIDKEDKITAVNAAVLTNKLLQFANGAVYDADHNYHVVHDLKIHALEEILESATGHPVLVAYQFESDKLRICTQLKRFKPEIIGKKDFVTRWNDGKIPFALAHPKSAGHGLNLQAGGHIVVFFGHDWSPELRAQFIARLHRKGQTEAVIIHDLITVNTMDERVLLVQGEKQTAEDYVMDAVKALINEHGGIRGQQFIKQTEAKYSFL